MSGSGASKLASAVITILAIALLMLLANLLYVLYRRRASHRQENPITAAGDEISQISSTESSISSFAASKDLLYFLCARPPPQFRIERNSAVTDLEAPGDLDSGRRPEMEAVDFDLLKIQGVFGPPRFLFTIVEEEREDIDSTTEKPLRAVTGKQSGENFGEGGLRRASLEDHFKAATAAVEIEVAGADDVTPFSTPCASPAYFTPSASPAREVVNLRSASGEEGSMTLDIEQRRLRGQNCHLKEQQSLRFDSRV